jgi:hypothetical protein
VNPAGRESLLRILFAPPEIARAAAVRLSSNDGWPWAFQTAEVWSVVPQLAGRVQELGLEPPVAQREAFKRVLIATFARSASRAKKGAAALERLEQSNIPALAFKGLASMARLYSTPANRSIKDADILVEPERVGDAVASLAVLGFAPPAGHELGSWQRFLDNSPGFSGNKAIVLSEPGGFEIDLHWSLGLPGMTPDLLLARRDVLTLFGCSVPVVSMGDGMILTARHAIRENLAVDAICRDLFDIRLSCQSLASRGLLAPVLETIAAATSVVPLLTLTGVLTALEGGGEVEEGAEILHRRASSKERLAAQQLQELFFHQVENGPIGRDLLYLSHSRPARQILAGASGNWREYRNFMRSLEEKLDGEEIPLGRRLWQLALALKNAGPRRWRGIRALGRQKYGDQG